MGCTRRPPIGCIVAGTTSTTAVAMIVAPAAGIEDMASELTNP
jgi:hypothetical protein